MRSQAAKALKAEKPAPQMRDLGTEVTKVDDVDTSKPASAPKASKKPKAEPKEKATRAESVATEVPKLGLKVSAGLNMGTLYPLKKRRNVIGRRVDASFPVQDERASRDHASIEYKKGHFMLTDLSSTNGTFLNNKAVTKTIYIKEGDRIRIGSTIFVVEEMNETNPEMVEKWASMTTVVPRAQILSKAKKELEVTIHKEDPALPRWKHLTAAITTGHSKHLQQARLFGVALAMLVVAAAILSSL